MPRGMPRQDRGARDPAAPGTSTVLGASGRRDWKPFRRGCSSRPRRRSFVATCWTDDKRGTIVYPVQIVGVLLKRAPAIAADRAGRAREHGKIARFHHDQRRAYGNRKRVV